MKKKSIYIKTKKLFAAAVVSAMLMSQGGMATYASESTAVTSVSSIIPDNITITDPKSLSEIELPDSKYGKLKWADSSITADQRTQSAEVIFTPSAGVDVSGLSGYDSGSNTVRASVTIVVTNIGEEPEEEVSEEEEIPEENEWFEEEASEEFQETEEETVPEENEQKEESAEDEAASEDVEEAEAPEKADTETTEEEAPAVESPEEDASDDENQPAEESDPENDEEETEEPTVTVTPEPENIFDQDISENEDDRSDEVPEDLTDEEMEELAEINHSYGGMCVMGTSLPWYVQFRVSDGSGYEFSNEANANIFKSYDFTLWDLKEDKEYTVPDGEYISIMIPVKTGYDYTVEHILANGATETIVPTLEGNMLIFSTHSFSPFGIAGNNIVVGGITATPTATPTPTPTRKITATPTPTTKPSSSSSSSSSSSGNTSSSSSSSSSGSTAATATPTPTEKPEKSSSVKTGDNSPIIPLIIVAAAAVVIAIVIIVIKKKK